MDGHIGGIAGENYNNSNLMIVNCFNSGNLHGEYITAGILAESWSGTYTNIKNCYNAGNILGGIGNSAGIAGARCCEWKYDN